MIGPDKHKRSYEHKHYNPYIKQKDSNYHSFKKIVEDNMFEIYEIQQLVVKQQALDLDFNKFSTRSKFILDLHEQNYSRIERSSNIKSDYNYKFNTHLGSIIYFKIKDSDLWMTTTLSFWIE